MDEKITKDLIKESDKLYKELLELFEKNFDPINRNTDYYKYLVFLFKDIVIFDTTIINKYAEINKNINECIQFFDNYNEKIKIKYSNALFLNKIKDIIKERNKIILKKIIECDEHIEIIKKYYIKLFFSNDFIDSNKSELIFKNKTVLTVDNDIENLKLGEIFTRYIFYLMCETNKITYDNPNINYWYNIANSSGFELFDINIFTDSFQLLRYNEKYFILIIFLINLLFNSNSNYIDVFNENKIKTNYKELIKIDKPKDDKKNKNKKKTKHKGGDKKDTINSILNPSSKNKKTGKITNNNLSNLKKKIKENIKHLPELNNKCEQFKNESKTSFITLINNTFCRVGNRFPISYEVPRMIFQVKLINLKNFYNHIPIITATKQPIHDYECNKINNLFTDFKFDIFQTLVVFDEQANFKDLTDKIPILKKKVLFLLYSLYSKKKTLYKEYLNSCDRIFEIKTKENNKESEQKNKEKLNQEKKNQEKLNQEKKNQEKLNQEKQQIYIQNKIKKNKEIQEKKNLIFIKKLDPKQKTEFIKIKNTLNILIKKIKKLEKVGHNDIKNDMMKLKLEKKYHNLIIKKLKISKNV